MLDEIFERIDRGAALTQEEAVELLSIKNLSEDYYRLLAKANELSQKEFKGQGYIFVQMGLNSAPCSGNCKFCSLACSSHSVEETVERTQEEVLAQISQVDFSKVAAMFLMTTADYDPEKFLEMGRVVRKALPANVDMVANFGDFDLDYAKKLKEAGFVGCYHLVRLREGTDTDIAPETRIKTLDAIRDTGLRLYYCLEPIGPEHTYEELAVEMIRAREYHVDIMAAMRRVNVAGTYFEKYGMIDDFELTKITAVTRVVSRPRLSMNIHEPNMTAMLAGVNQLYAELGVNPRDNKVSTEKNRGYSLETVTEMLRTVGYEPGHTPAGF